MKLTVVFAVFLLHFGVFAFGAEEKELNITSVNLYETSTNRAFKVTVEGRPVFFRVGRDHPEELGIDREKEIENYKIAEQLGLAPTLLGYHLKNGLLMIEFIEGISPSVERIREHSMLDKIVLQLKNLHDHSSDEGRPAEKTAFSINDALLKNLETLGVAPEDEKKIRQWLKVRTSFEEDYYREIPFAICHGDLYRENLLETEDGRVYLIDWEYSFYGPIIDDLGKLCATNWLDDSAMEYLVEAYWGEMSSKMLKKLKQNIFMQQLNFYLWLRIQAHHHPEQASSYLDVGKFAEQQLESY
jgi:thiamine kinase-like enzyme